MKKCLSTKAQNVVEFIILLAAVISVVLAVTRFGAKDDDKGPIQSVVSDTIKTTANLIDQGNEDIVILPYE